MSKLTSFKFEDISLYYTGVWFTPLVPFMDDYLVRSFLALKFWCPGLERFKQTKKSRDFRVTWINVKARQGMLIHRGHDHWLGLSNRLALEYGALESVSFRAVPGNYNSQSEMLWGSLGLANINTEQATQVIQKWRAAMRMSVCEWVASSRSHGHIQQCPDSSVLIEFQKETTVLGGRLTRKPGYGFDPIRNLSKKKNGIHYHEDQKKPSI